MEGSEKFRVRAASLQDISDAGLDSVFRINTGTLSASRNDVGALIAGPPLDTLDIGRLATADPYRLIGDIGEILVFDNAISATDRQAIEQYLGTKYGIAVP